MQFTNAILATLLALSPLAALAAPSPNRPTPRDLALDAEIQLLNYLQDLADLKIVADGDDEPAAVQARSELSARAELEDRSGWTCNFMGNKACQVKVCFPSLTLSSFSLLFSFESVLFLVAGLSWEDDVLT
jgi:hypothetical protein